MDPIQRSIRWIEKNEHRLDTLIRMDPADRVGDLFHEYHRLKYEYWLCYDHLCDMANAGNEMADDWLEQYAKG